MDIKVESVGAVCSTGVEQHREHRQPASNTAERQAHRAPHGDQVELTEAALAASDTRQADENSAHIAELIGGFTGARLALVTTSLDAVEHGDPGIARQRGGDVSYTRSVAAAVGAQFRIDLEGVVAAQDGTGVAFRLEAVLPARAASRQGAINADTVFITLAGSAARVTAETFVFDLNADGVDDGTVSTREAAAARAVDQAVAGLTLARYEHGSEGALAARGFSAETVELAASLAASPGAAPPARPSLDERV